MLRQLFLCMTLVTFCNTGLAVEKHIKIMNKTAGELEVSHFAKFNISDLPDHIDVPHSSSTTEYFHVDHNVTTLELIVKVVKSNYFISNYKEDACRITAHLHVNDEPPLLHAIVISLTDTNQYRCKILNHDTILVEEPNDLFFN